MLEEERWRQVSIEDAHWKTFVGDIPIKICLLSREHVCS